MKYINKHIEEEYIHRLPNLDQLQREQEREREIVSAKKSIVAKHIVSHRIERSVMASTAINATVISKFFFGASAGVLSAL